MMYGATRTLKKYEIIIETSKGYVKTVTTNDYNQALRMYEKCKLFAKNHNITLTVSLFGQGFLYETDTINPTRLIKII